MCAVWKMGNVYEFDYDGLISTSMPGIGPQQAGASIKGRLLIESLASDLIEMRLVDTTAKTFHDIHGMEQTSDEGAHSSNLADRHHLEKPVHVRMVNGKVIWTDFHRHQLKFRDLHRNSLHLYAQLLPRFPS